MVKFSLFLPKQQQTYWSYGRRNMLATLELLLAIPSPSLPRSGAQLKSQIYSTHESLHLLLLNRKKPKSRFPFITVEEGRFEVSTSH